MTTVKCVVWDLDGTLWDGVLVEDRVVTPRDPVLDVVRELDRRGIVSSIASRNDADLALGELTRLGVVEYFLHPQIHWGPKSGSVRAVADALNIGTDALAFVDDQAFERDEVGFCLPEVLCIDAGEAETIPDMARMQPRFVTEDARRRRQMYRSDDRRRHDEEAHDGTPQEFLQTLDMRLTIASAQESDLHRAEELTVRTNQLNATGRTYSHAELDALRLATDHDLLVVALEDRYGTYGTIGLALVHRDEWAWTLKLMLMSCRVMSRGVGTVLLHHLMGGAARAGVPLRAHFVDTGRNRAMRVAYRLAGFREVGRDGDLAVLENDCSRVVAPPPYMTVEAGAS